MPSLKFFKIISAVLLCASSFNVSGQNRRAPKRESVPRVGVIKNLDEIRGKIIDRCASHFIQPGKDMVKDEYIFISAAFFKGPGNFDVVMNLDGRNVWLEPLETRLRYDPQYRNVFARHAYRSRKIRITVSFQVQPALIYPHEALIVVRKGKAARKIRAFVVEQCAGGGGA